MTKTRTFAVALSLCAAVACSEQGPMPTNPAAPTSLEGTNAKPPGDVPVTSNIGAGDIAGDGSLYTNSHMSQNSGGWYLDLRSSQNTTRVVNLNFGNEIAGTGPDNTDPPNTPVNPGSGPYKVFMYSACNLINYGVRLLDMPVTEPPTWETCPMVVQFEVGSKRYLLRMNSHADEDTDDVIVTRVASGWQIRQSVETGSNRARLHLQGKGNAGLVAQGDYYMSFSIDVTIPIP